MNEADWLECADPFALYHFLRAETLTYRTRWQGWVTAPRFRISERRLRLIACACCARVAHLMPTTEARDLLAAAEALAEGEAAPADVEASDRACQQSLRRRSESGRGLLGYEHDALNAALLVHRTEAAGRPGALTAAARAWTGARVWRRHVESLGGVLRVNPADFAPLEAVVRACDRAYIASEGAAEAARQAALLRDVVGNPFRPFEVPAAWLEWNGGLVPRLASSIYADRRFDDLPILADALEDAGCTDTETLSHCRGGGPHVRGCWVVDLILSKDR